MKKFAAIFAMLFFTTACNNETSHALVEEIRIRIAPTEEELQARYDQQWQDQQDRGHEQWWSRIKPLVERDEATIINVYFTYYWAVPEQTDSTPCIPKDTRYNVCTLDLRSDTVYVAVPQDQWDLWRAKKEIWFGQYPVKVIDVFAKKHNGKSKMDMLVPVGKKFPNRYVPIITIP